MKDGSYAAWIFAGITLLTTAGLIYAVIYLFLLNRKRERLLELRARLEGFRDTRPQKELVSDRLDLIRSLMIASSHEKRTHIRFDEDPENLLDQEHFDLLVQEVADLGRQVGFTVIGERKETLVILHLTWK